MALLGRSNISTPGTDNIFSDEDASRRFGRSRRPSHDVRPQTACRRNVPNRRTLSATTVHGYKTTAIAGWLDMTQNAVPVGPLAGCQRRPHRGGKMRLVRLDVAHDACLDETLNMG
jgi:hypothetical protein